MSEITDRDRIIAIGDEVHQLRLQMRSFGDAGMTALERAEMTKLKDALAMREIEIKSLAGELASLRKELATKQSAAQLKASSKHVLEVVADATVDIVMKETDDLRAETRTAIEDASTGWKREASRATAAAEANQVAAISFLRRAIHTFAS